MIFETSSFDSISITADFATFEILLGKNLKMDVTI